MPRGFNGDMQIWHESVRPRDHFRASGLKTSATANMHPQTEEEHPAIAHAATAKINQITNTQISNKTLRHIPTIPCGTRMTRTLPDTDGV